MAKNSKPDAAESNAGDDFHVLWAVRKCLGLLNFEPLGLKAVSVESVSAEDEKFLDKDGLLGVDLTEYYGGRTFKDATKVVISQLKYSTRHAEKTWTASQICTGRKGSIAGSVVERLGALFREISTLGTSEQVRKKLAIKLVSNRPVDLRLAESIAKVKELLKPGNKQIATYAQLKLQLNDRESSDTDKLCKASGLDDVSFLIFLQVLNFSDCRAGDSFFQRQKSIREITSLGSFEAISQFAKLRMLVWEKMLPAARRRHTLCAEHILYEFGFNDLADLFPVSFAIQQPPRVVLREQLASIANVIADDRSSLICLHGGAGVGKSTLVSMIPGILPAGSKVVIFDCYGGGAYGDPEDKRHKPENAYLQLANRLALETGTPFLLARERSNDFYIKEFSKRLQLAVNILKVTDPGAILLIVIDAADNSITAASQYFSESFIIEFVHLSLPAGCKVLVSSRTERKNTLGLPIYTVYVPIAPFTFDESKTLLQPYFADLTDLEIEDFRELTHANPRVMSYVLESPGSDLSEKTAPLRPGGKSLEDIFRSRIEQAEKRSGESATTTRFLTFLVTLPRPVPIDYLQEISGLSEGLLSDLKTELWHGLVFRNERFTFRDEDFETYLRKTYIADRDTYTAIAGLLLANAGSDEYASQHLAAFLSHAGMTGELIAIVLERRYLAYPQDPVRNKEVFIERTRIAMTAGAPDGLNYLKLQMVAAEAAKSNKVLEDILLNKADLAAAYGNLQTNQKIYFQSGNPGWFGPVHFRSAAIFSREKETLALAREHLSKGRSWLQYRHHLDEEELEGYPITGTDMAFAAEAVLRLEGVEKCIAWVDRWQPTSFSYEVAEILLTNLITTDPLQRIAGWLKGRNFRIDIQLLIVKVFFEKGLRPPVPVPDMLQAAVTLGRLFDKVTYSLKEAIMCFVEYALRSKFAYEQVAPFLDLISDDCPSHVPRFYEGADYRSESTGSDLLFRKGAIRKVFLGASFVVADFYPERIRSLIESADAKSRQKGTEEKKEFDDFYKHFLPVYQMRADFLFGRISQKKVNSHIAEFVAKLGRDWDLSYRYPHQINRVHRFMSLKLLDIVFYCRQDSTLELIRDGLDKVKKNIDTRLCIVEKLSEKKQFFPHTLKLLTGIEKQIDDHIMAGSEIIGYYTRAAIVASRASKAAGKYYFDKMVLASNEIDLEAHDQLKCINAVAGAGRQIRDQRLAYSFSRYTEYCFERLRGWDDFPWDDAVAAIFKLDAGSAWQTLCRWDHRSVRQIRKHLVQLIELSLEQGYIDCVVAGALVIDNQYFWPGINKLVGTILEGFDLRSSSSLKNTFVKDFFHALQCNLKPDSNRRVLDEFYELIKDGRFLDHRLVAEIRQFRDELSTILDKESVSEIPFRPHQSAVRKPENWLDKRLKGVRIDNSLDIEQILREYRQAHEDHHGIVATVCSRLKNKVKPGEEIVFLNAILDVPGGYLNYYAFEEVISELLSDYNYLPELAQWRRDNFPAVIKKWFSRFVLRDYFDSKSLLSLAVIFQAGEAELVRVVRAVLPEFLNDLPAGILYQLFTVTAIGEGTPDIVQLLEWTIVRWAQLIKPDFADGEFEVAAIPVLNAGETIAGFIRFSLGHPAKAVRWRIAHSLRKLARLKHDAIFTYLLAQQDEKKLPGFQDNGLTYFWMSAKLYLWISLDRIVKETPEMVLPFSKTAFSQIIDEELPHAQIKYFARSVCLQLNAAYLDVFTGEELRQIETCLESIKVGKKRNPNGYQDRKELVPAALRFDFDHMDTLRYWYEPLGRIFDVTSNDVAVIADRYISEKWGFTGDVRKANHVHSNDYGDTMNRHGSETSMETLRLYYEYHAMFCAAYELLLSKPEVEDTYFDHWADWIREWGVCWGNFWLADFRDPIPSEVRYWTIDRHALDWEYAIQPEDFHRVLGIEPKRDYLVVNEGSNLYYGKDSERTYVHSGLVDMATGPALLRAMQTASSFDVYLPVDHDDDDENEPQAEDRFKVQGWLFDVKTDAEGLDDQDPLFNDILKIRLKPAASLTDQLGLTLTEDFRFSYAGHVPEEWTTRYQVWSSARKKRSYGDLQSSGQRFLIKKEALLRFLVLEQKCLIVECQIKRTIDTGDYQESYPNYCLIYLIYPNGTIETYRGNHSIR